MRRIHVHMSTVIMELSKIADVKLLSAEDE